MNKDKVLSKLSLLIERLVAEGRVGGVSLSLDAMSLNREISFFDDFLKKAEDMYQDDPKLLHIQKVISDTLETARAQFAVLKLGISFRLYLLTALNNASPEELSEKNIDSLYKKVLKKAGIGDAPDETAGGLADILWNSALAYYYLKTGKYEKAIEKLLTLLGTFGSDEWKEKVNFVDDLRAEVDNIQGMFNDDEDDFAKWDTSVRNILEIFQNLLGADKFDEYLSDKDSHLQDWVDSGDEEDLESRYGDAEDEETEESLQEEDDPEEEVPTDEDPAPEDPAEEDTSILGKHIENNRLTKESFMEMLKIFDESLGMGEQGIVKYFENIHKATADIDMFIDVAGAFLDLTEVSSGLVLGIDKSMAAFGEIRNLLNIKGGSVLAPDVHQIVERHPLLSKEDKLALKKDLEKMDPDVAMDKAKKFVAADSNTYLIGFLSGFIFGSKQTKGVSSKSSFNLKVVNFPFIWQKFEIKPNDRDIVDDPNMKKHLSVHKKIDNMQTYLKDTVTDKTTMKEFLDKLSADYDYKTHAPEWPHYLSAAAKIISSEPQPEMHVEIINTFMETPIDQSAVKDLVTLVFRLRKAGILKESLDAATFASQVINYIKSTGEVILDRNPEATVEDLFKDSGDGSSTMQVIRQNIWDALSNVKEEQRKDFISYMKTNADSLGKAFGILQPRSTPARRPGRRRRGPSESIDTTEAAQKLIEVISQELRNSNGKEELCN